MIKYLDLLKTETYEIRNKIQDLNDKLKDKELEITKEYFQIGKKAIYRDSDGYIEGVISAVDGLYVTIDVKCVNGNIVNRPFNFSTFEARELNLL